VIDLRTRDEIGPGGFLKILKLVGGIIQVSLSGGGFDDACSLRASIPAGLSDDAFGALFTKDKPIVFAFHRYLG
jgi:hypothetical protein